MATIKSTRKKENGQTQLRDRNSLLSRKIEIGLQIAAIHVDTFSPSPFI
ncbi:hypothetical protein OEJ37_20145 [Burkholderia sp. BKH01]|nr:hypothetical protein [Burkholderia sp. BKH01]MCU9955674.1 hypothetical protein [Burkholderia sp. BKH01]